jgi:predicted nucleotidyltransferase
MNRLEKKVIERFKSLIEKKLSVHKIVLFGSRARGDAEPYSDMDVLVILDKLYDEQDIDYISDCAWEAGFQDGIVIVPVVFSKDEWENSPERYSLLAQAVEREGVLI